MPTDGITMAEILLALVPALVAGVVLTPVIRRLALRLGAIDHPGARSVHAAPVPYMGGLALFGAFVVGLVGFWLLRRPDLTPGNPARLLGLVLGGLIVVCVGLIDDLGPFWTRRVPWLADREGRGLRPSVKLAAETGAALVLIAFGVHIGGIHRPLTPATAPNAYLGFATWLSYAITVLWVVAITNAVNLIDGLDGLAAGVSAIACVTLLAVVLPLLSGGAHLAVLGCAALLGACLAFLPWNFHPARVFMGDAGALFLGFALSAVSIVGMNPTKEATVLTVAVPALAMGLPVFDTLMAIVRRFRRGQRVAVADRAHTHHRLLDLGLGHRDAVLALYVVSGWLGVSALAIGRSAAWVGGGILLFVVLSGILVVRLARRVAARAARNVATGSAHSTSLQL